MNKIYLQEDNGGRGITINEESKWYYSNCAPTGFYGDVDILESDIDIVVENLKTQASRPEFDIDTSWMDEVEEWENFTIEDIEKCENENRTCDFTSFTFVCEIQ